MSDVIQVKQWENKLLEVSLWVISYKKEFYFFGREVAMSLGYKDPKKAIQEHIDLKDKMAIEELLGPDYKVILQRSFPTGEKNSPVEFFQKLRRNQKIINEFAIYSLCMKSKLKRIEPFQRWIYSTIKEIRVTGSYTLPSGPVDNPLDLVAKIESLEREIEDLKKVKTTCTCNKKTQTQEISRLPIKKLENRLKRSMEKVKRVELELEKSIREITTTSSSRSSSFSYSSSSRRSSSSDN